MIITCNIKGVPRIIQTIQRTKSFIGLNLDIEPKAIKSPSGNAETNDNANISQVVKKPCNSLRVMEKKSISVNLF